MVVFGWQWVWLWFARKWRLVLREGIFLSRSERRLDHRQLLQDNDPRCDVGIGQRESTMRLTMRWARWLT